MWQYAVKDKIYGKGRHPRLERVTMLPALFSHYLRHFDPREDPMWPFGLYFIIANTLLNSFILATIDQTLTLAFNIHTVSIDSESTSTALVNPWLCTIHWCTIFEKICVWGIKDKTLSVMLILCMILKNCKVQNYWEKVQISAHIASD